MGPQIRHAEGKKRHPFASNEIHKFDEKNIHLANQESRFILIENVFPFFFFLSSRRATSWNFSLKLQIAVRCRKGPQPTRLWGQNLENISKILLFELWHDKKARNIFLAIFNYEIGEGTNIWWQQKGFDGTEHPKYMLASVNTSSVKTYSVKFAC